jgi:hypothetical protein
VQNAISEQGAALPNGTGLCCGRALPDMRATPAAWTNLSRRRKDDHGSARPDSTNPELGGTPAVVCLVSSRRSSPCAPNPELMSRVCNRSPDGQQCEY